MHQFMNLVSVNKEHLHNLLTSPMVMLHSHPHLYIDQLETRQITKYKARLNVHGEQQHFDTYTPVVTWIL
eukprot:7832105-Ditylum_brightwellii.AAC.1